MQLTTLRAAADESVSHEKRRSGYSFVMLGPPASGFDTASKLKSAISNSRVVPSDQRAHREAVGGVRNAIRWCDRCG